ncbi:MAG TPA: glycosyl hydrolase, partial [Gemmatimonadota bacterium]|nr:glycosyl hydrolase [Gemmatimonadota bacterium]
TRGVFRTDDGGRSWSKVLFISDSTGVVSLAMDPSNPDVLYAGSWAVERRPWALLSGNREGGIWKSTDGGGHWTKLGGGLPTGLVGKITLDVSRSEPDRVYAIIEAPKPEGAVYRSDDAGETWRKVGTDPRLQQRPYYFHHIFAHPTDPNTVYVTGFRFYESIDAGRTWKTVDTPHGDNHALWIDPKRPEIMAEGNDGGATITLDGGKTWSTLLNQPTAQFYRVTTDDRFPYRLYGAQQDNSTISVPAWDARGATPQGSWREVGGCESGHIAVHGDIVYSGCYHGELDRYDMATGLRRQVIPYAQAQEGQAPAALKYRFQWNSPIVLDPQHPDVVYHTSQVVHRSDDGGQTWTVISPDLTYDDSARLAFPSPTITRDLTGVEVYGTIFALTPSPHEASTIWAGTDDGRVWITRNDGGDWTEITPPGLPRWSTVNTIEVSPHAAGKAYVTVYRYRMDDFTPYVYRTTDYGAHWTRIADGTRGIPAGYATRVVREDPAREGLLYAGTEYGMFVSFDDGGHWQSLQMNLPVVPITDLQVHGSDLVVATQGRSFWILDDLSPLRQIDGKLAGAVSGTGGHVLYRPRDAWRTDVRRFRGAAAPEAPPRGAVLDWYFDQAPQGPVTLTIADSAGRVLRRFTSDASRDGAYEGGRRGPAGRPRWEADEALGGRGMHRFAWDLEMAAVDHPSGVFVWGSLGAPKVAPGTYRATLSAD